jgi:mRNA-degrading endonuclease RelE of RelBE toxin-antitoxin system
MTWQVELTRKVNRQIAGLPEHVTARLFALLKEIESTGPVRGNWPNYGKLADRVHHCHIKKGHPTYVAVWEEMEHGIRIVEVKYVGTHEKAPY